MTNREVITENADRWRPFLNWLCEQGSELYPQFDWLAVGPYPRSTSFTPDALRIEAQLGGARITGDILWFVAEWMSRMSIKERKETAKILLNEIVEPHIVVDDTICKKVGVHPTNRILVAVKQAISDLRRDTPELGGSND